jgi:predicted DCC family thiol-disulfide oxidoreductase YuxK
MKDILIFDGDCGICTFTAEFIKKRVDKISLEIKPYQVLDLKNIHSELDEDMTSKSVYFFKNKNNQIYSKSKAVFLALKKMNGFYKIMGYLLDNPLFVFIFNPIYNIVARNRTKISKMFGLNACNISNYK